MTPAPTHTSALIVRVGAQLCAIPLEHVVETMRPLPTRPLAGVPPFVAGAAIVRGEAVPVVQLAALLVGDAGPSASEPSDATPATRFVKIRCGERSAAVVVDAVIGVAEAPSSAPVPLLSRAAEGAVAALGTLDRSLLAVLDASSIVPEEAWRALDARGERA